MLQLTDAQKVGDKYWIDAGEVTMPIASIQYSI